MSWLLFMDESGHDHKQMPYEVRGGVALHARQIWPFVRAVQALEVDMFGTPLAEYKKEFKGSNLLDKQRVTWAQQDGPMADAERRSNARAFLTKGLQKVQPNRREFTAYGQACNGMALGVFRLLREHRAVLFASAIPRGVMPSDDYKAQNFLRKDFVFLLERYFYFLRGNQETGLLVLDRVEDANDKSFVRRLEKYFTKTSKGVERSDWIVPSPMFVSSFLSVPVQAADLCMYCLNWGYRRPRWGMDAPARAEIAKTFGRWIKTLQYSAELRSGATKRKLFGIVYVPDPYTSR